MTKNSIGVILRSYNNTKIFPLLKKLDTFLEVGAFVVVINKQQDKIKTKQKLLKLKLHKPLTIIELQPYSWSLALNSALEYIQTPYTLVISNEVSLKHINIRELLQNHKKKKNISVSYSNFYGYNQKSYTIARNTFALYNTRIFQKVGLFNTKLDNMGGMEDYEFMLRALKYNLHPYKTKHKVKLAPNKKLSYKLKNEQKAMQKIDSLYFN